MEDGAVTTDWSANRQSRFEFTPPRHFLLPAVLLLLAEEPGYGYHLAKGLNELRFGRVDRPSVYRALGQLEKDGLVVSWSGAPRAGTERRVYGLTEAGERALREWMGVIKEERDGLDRVLRRYVATGTIDAILAEAEGGWTEVTGHGGSSVSSTAERHAARRPAVSAVSPPAIVTEVHPVLDDIGDIEESSGRYRVVPERSAVLIEARSSVGQITFGALGVTGAIDAEIHDGAISLGTQPSAHLEIEVGKLRSGNRLYDAELLRRIDARRHPIVTLDLRTCTVAGSANRFRVAGDVTLHGASRAIEGTVLVTPISTGKLSVSGEQSFDIRDFDIASPTVLMLRIYPDVKVQLQIEAEQVEQPREREDIR